MPNPSTPEEQEAARLVLVQKSAAILQRWEAEDAAQDASTPPVPAPAPPTRSRLPTRHNPPALLDRDPLVDNAELDQPSPLDDLFGDSAAAERLLVAVRRFLSRRHTVDDNDPAVLLPLLDEIDTLSIALRRQLQERG